MLKQSGKIEECYLVEEDVALEAQAAHLAGVVFFAPAAHPRGWAPVFGGGALAPAAPHSLALQLGLQVVHLVPQSAAFALDHVQQVPQLVHRRVRVHRLHRRPAVVLFGLGTENVIIWS
jgi:hypothetical protein